jgi:hypothetical protein
VAKDPEVVALEAQLRAVDAALKAVEADAPKAQRALGGFGDEAKDAAKGTGDATVSTSAFGVALGNKCRPVQPLLPRSRRRWRLH